MQQMKLVIRITAWVVIVLGLLVVERIYAVGQPSQGQVVELTKVDAFATHNWASADIRVLDFRLGMSRAEAEQNARKRNLGLNCADACDVCDPRGVLCNGISIHFGTDENVDSITIVRPLSEAPKDLREFSIVGQLKGQTLLFFTKYSNVRRLRLFGTEDDKVEDPKVRSTRYVYSRRGLEIYLSLSSNRHITDSTADLAVSFKRPK